MRVVTYRRVSTEMQSEEGFSLEAQKKRLTAYVESQGWSHIDDYCDEGKSAKNMDRPELQKMLSDMEDGKFDVILVYKLDRLVRSVLDLHELLKTMDKHDVKFKSATEVFDTTSATGRLFITMVGAMAEWERETIAERVYFGMRQKIEEKSRAGGTAPFGYKIIQEGKDKGRLEIVEEEAKWVRWIFDQFSIKGKRAIALELNEKGIKPRKSLRWSESGISYLIKNPVYIGYLRWNNSRQSKEKEPILIPEVHDAIIDEEVFDDIQRTINTRNKTKSKRSDYIFSGILKCHRCGNPFKGGTTKKDSGYIYKHYKCVGRFNYKECDQPTISEELVEDHFLALLKNFDYDSITVNQENTDFNELERQLLKIDNKIERMREDYYDGELPKAEYRERKRIEESKKNEIMEMIDSFGVIVDQEALEKSFKTIWENWSKLDTESKKQAVHELMNHIEVDVIKKGLGGTTPVIEVTDTKLK